MNPRQKEQGDWLTALCGRGANCTNENVVALTAHVDNKGKLYPSVCSARSLIKDGKRGKRRNPLRSTSIGSEPVHDNLRQGRLMPLA